MARTTIRTEDITASEVTTAKMAVDPTNASNLASGSVPTAQLGNVPPNTGLQNDIATLALHSAIADNKAAFNLANAFVDQYEDSTGLDVLTDVVRDTSGEYMSSVGDDTDILLLVRSDTTNGSTVFTDSSSYGRTITAQGSPDHSTAVTLSGFGSSSIKLGGPSEALYAAASADFKIAADFTVDWWMELDRWSSDSEGLMGISDTSSTAVGGENEYLNIANSNTGTSNVGITVAGTQVDTGYSAYNTSDWFHNAIVRSGSGTNNCKWYVDGVETYEFTATGSMPSVGTDNGIFYMGHSGNRYMDGYLQEVRVTKDARTTIVGDPMYISSGDNFTAPTAPYSLTKANATGNYTSSTETASATVSEMGIVVLYKNASGTATLNTDLIAAVSADGGSNYETVTLTAGGTFSTGINLAVANGVSISNTGTAPKYKISFANQAEGSKVAQVHGVALIY
jgi:hypothetical protein